MKKYLILLLSFSVLSVQAHGPFSQFGNRDWSERVNKYRNLHRQYPEPKKAKTQAETQKNNSEKNQESPKQIDQELID